MSQQSSQQTQPEASRVESAMSAFHVVGLDLHLRTSSVISCAHYSKNNLLIVKGWSATIGEEDK